MVINYWWLTVVTLAVCGKMSSWLLNVGRLLSRRATEPLRSIMEDDYWVTPPPPGHVKSWEWGRSWQLSSKFCLHWCQGNLPHLHKVQTLPYYVALLMALLLLVLTEPWSYSLAEYLTLGFLCLTGQTVGSSWRCPLSRSGTSPAPSSWPWLCTPCPRSWELCRALQRMVADWCWGLMYSLFRLQG